MEASRLAQNPTSQTPDLEQQVEFWDFWNSGVGETDILPYMVRMRDVAVHWAGAFSERPRILEVGCGTGWLCEGLVSVGPVVGIDLSPAAIQIAKRRCPSVRFLCGDLFRLGLPQPFDVIVSADTIAHVPNQPAFMDRLTELLSPGGVLILMSQNAYSFSRTDWVRPLAPGQIRRWPSRVELRRYVLERGFDVEHLSTVAPFGATAGIYRLVNSRRVWAALCTFIGSARAIALYERLLLGRDWIVVARRR